MPATATKKTEKPDSAPAQPPVTFAEIAERKMRERIEAYRSLVKRHASGQAMESQDYERAAELLEQLGLPDYAFTRDAEAVQRHGRTHAKWAAAVENEPASRQRAKEVAAEVQALTAKLRALNEELLRAQAASSKSGAYAQTFTQLAADHPQVLADIDTAVRLRLEEINRRRQIGGAE